MKKNKNVKKRRLNKKTKFIIALLVVIAIISSCFVFFNNTKKATTKKVKVVDKIDKFDYTVNEKDTKLFKDTFKELKTILSKDEIDNKKYSEVVAKLFVIDFFTLNNKMTKNDVGGVQFVYSSYKSSFIDKARDEFYKYIKNNIYNDRKQDLPIVSSVSVSSVEKIDATSDINLNDLKDVEAYEVKMNITYEKDLGYQKTATVIVIKDENKFSVAKLSE